MQNDKEQLPRVRVDFIFIHDQMQERICLCCQPLRPFKVCVRELHYYALMCYECETRNPLMSIVSSVSQRDIFQYGNDSTDFVLLISHCKTTGTAHARRKLFGEDTIAEKETIDDQNLNAEGIIQDDRNSPTDQLLQPKGKSTGNNEDDVDCAS